MDNRTTKRECKTCEWWKYGGLQRDNSERGDCRNVSPRFIMPGDTRAAWPITLWYDWCAQWEQSGDDTN